MDPRIRRLYWQATALLLGAHFAGWAPALALAIALTGVQCLHFGAHASTLRDFPLQVRAGYLALLLAGLWPPLAFLHVVQFAGVNALLVADYCPLARMLLLAPWNRSVPLSWALVRWTVMAAPQPGSVRDRLQALAQAPRG